MPRFPFSRATRRRSALGFGTAAALLSLSLSASATTCSITLSCEMTTRSEAASTRASINSKISSMQEAVSQAVNQARVDIVQAIANASTAITGSLAHNTDSINNNAAEIDLASRMRAASDVRPSMGCGATASARAGGSTQARHGSGARSNYSPSHVDPRWKRALERTGQIGKEEADKLAPKDKLPPVTPAVQAADVGAGACKTFADEKSARGFLCSLLGMPKEQPTPYVDADIKAETLFDGPQKPGNMTKNLSIEARGVERDARAAYIAMINNPIPPSSPRQSTMTTAEGAVYMAHRSEYDAARSLAAYPIYEWDRLTSASRQNADALNAINRTDEKFLKDYFNGISPDAFSAAQTNGASPLLLIDLEVERRIGNPEWHKRMGAASDVEKAAEDLMINAYSLRLQRDTYIAQLQTNVLLGKLLQDSATQRYVAQTDATRRALDQSEAPRADSPK